jgi:hypothetical protein
VPSKCDEGEPPFASNTTFTASLVVSCFAALNGMAALSLPLAFCRRDVKVALHRCEHASNRILVEMTVLYPFL